MFKLSAGFFGGEEESNSASRFSFLILFNLQIYLKHNLISSQYT